MEDENKKLLDIVNCLEGVSYFDWMKVQMIVDRKFYVQKRELERSLQLPMFEERDIRW